VIRGNTTDMPGFDFPDWAWRPGRSDSVGFPTKFLDASQRMECNLCTCCIGCVGSRQLINVARSSSPIGFGGKKDRGSQRSVTPGQRDRRPAQLAGSLGFSVPSGSPTSCRKVTSEYDSGFSRTKHLEDPRHDQEYGAIST